MLHNANVKTQNIIEENNATPIQEAPKPRSTRTKQRLLASESEGSSSDSITKSAASPRVKVQNVHEVLPNYYSQLYEKWSRHTVHSIRD